MGNESAGPSTEKQRAWLNFYFGDAHFNATQAARLAGFAWPNKAGPRLKQELAGVIEERLEHRALAANEVLALLTDQASADMQHFIEIVEDEDGGYQGWRLDLKKAREAGLTHLIKKVKYNANGDPEIELYDSQAALDKLARALGVYKDRMQTLNIDVSNLTDDQLERIAAGEDPLDVIRSTASAG